MFSLQNTLGRLSPHLAHAAAETASAFFSASLTANTALSLQRLTDFGSLRCSQKNIGENYEMTLNLAVDKIAWNKMFISGESEVLKMDAFCEMANCICGTVLADPSFSDEFGYMIPCVPCFGPSPQGSMDSSTLRGVFRLGACWIHYTFTLQETVSIGLKSNAPSRLMASI